ncbi:MAG: LysR family transcriptional regulator [Chitinophagaceae bacterium]|nr:LysR family transcriptional regulator [Polaromonas sp.]
MTDFLQTPRRNHLIELRLWRQFVILADELHFGRAAQRLNMTQPPLTQAIAQLELVLGLSLFDRTKRRVQLTSAGAALVPQVQDLLALAAALPAHAQAAANGKLGRLRLAFVSTVGFALLPQWVRAFREQHPRVALELIEATGDVQLELLMRGEIDAGFVLHSPGFAPPGFQCQRIASEPLVLALPEHHLLAKAARLSLGKVLPEPLVMFPRRIVPSLHDAIFGVYHAAGCLPQVSQEAIQMQTIVNLVSAGLGVAWVPASVRQFQRSGVVYKSVSPGKSAPQAALHLARCETSLVWPADTANAVRDKFVAFVSRSAA